MSLKWPEMEWRMRSWYEIKAKQGAADVYIYDEIGAWGITASAFVNELRGLKGKALNVYINSPGGSVFDGIAIYNALSRHEGGVNVTVDSLAASIASVIAQAGGTRTMAKSSAMMIHDAWGIAVGDPATMEKMRDELDKLSDSIADIYADRAGGTADEWRSRMADETWYKADDAVAAGLADAVAGAAQNAYTGRVFNLSKFNKVPEWVNQDENDPAEESGDEPETNEEEKDMDEQAIRQALGLDEDGDILAAISSLKGAAKDISTGEKGEANELRRELATTRQQYLTSENEMTQRILALEDRNRQKAAEHTVDSAIQRGRVAPKDRDVALKLALNDPDSFASFAANLRVDLNERGIATDADLAGLEPTKEEAAVAASMGISREDLIKQKAADKGIVLPK